MAAARDCPRVGPVRAPMDLEDQLLATVLCRSLTSTEMDARRLRYKKAKALRLTIEHSKREAKADAVAKAKAAWLAKAQECAVRRMADIISSDEDSNFSDNSHMKGYSRTAGRKGKWPARK